MKLKDEMGFEGFIVSDWNSVQNITGSTYYEQVVKSINAGIDMLMEPDTFNEAKQIIRIPTARKTHLKAKLGSGAKCVITLSEKDTIYPVRKRLIKVAIPM